MTTDVIKAVMITGSYPPSVCGVGDYTANVMNYLTDWKLYTSDKWRLSTLFTHIHQINCLGLNNIVIQYPTEGYHWSLVPHFIVMYYRLFTRKKIAVVLHEFSQSSLKAKFASSLLILFCNSLVLTTNGELQFIRKYFRWLSNKLKLIPIGSNVERSKCFIPFEKREIDLLYFGHIRPNKGLDKFLDVAKFLMKRNESLRIQIVGQVPNGYEEFCKTIEQKCTEYSVKLKKNVSMEDLPMCLQQCKYAYLPFPDGLTLRRGSFLACINNGVNVISVKGALTPKDLNEIVLFVNPDSTNAMEEIESIIKKSQKESFPQEKADRIVMNWNNIADMYNKIFY